MPVLRPPCLESDTVLEEPSKWWEEAVEGREACHTWDHLQAFAGSGPPDKPSVGNPPQGTSPNSACHPVSPLLKSPQEFRSLSA